MNEKLKAPVACALLGATFLFAACGDEEPSTNNDDNAGGTSTGGTFSGGTANGGTAGVAMGGTAPSGGTAGTPTGGAAGAPSGGAGGAPGGAAGAGGASGSAGAGGMPGGAGGMGGMMCRSPLPMGGMGGMAGMAGAGGSAAGAGGAGGSAAGAGGAAAGAGGAAAGAGGAAAGAGGAAAGAGGAAAGAGGAAAGAGGAAAGAGGAGGAGNTGPRIISTFDMPGSLTITGLGRWELSSMPVPDTFIQRNMTEGASCAGALEMTIPFTAYGTSSDALLNMSPVQNWVGYTKLHVKVKILMPSTGNLNHINGVQLGTNSNNYANYDGKFTAASVFADFGWHDIEFDLTLGASAPPPSLDSMIQLQVQLQTPMTAPATGPAAPVTTTILIDDVWIQ